MEVEDPLTNAAKTTAKATNTQTTVQVKAANQSFVDQLYGNEAPTDQEAAAQPAVKSMQPPTIAPVANMQAPEASEDQSKLEETRQKLAELQHLHKRNYIEPTFGEEAQQKRMQQEEQERQMKEQEEQEEEERKAEEKAQNDEEMEALLPQGKGQAKGRNRMMTPIALTQAKTKTEINRGSSG